MGSTTTVDSAERGRIMECTTRAWPRPSASILHAYSILMPFDTAFARPRLCQASRGLVQVQRTFIRHIAASPARTILMSPRLTGYRQHYLPYDGSKPEVRCVSATSFCRVVAVVEDVLKGG